MLTDSDTGDGLIVRVDGVPFTGEVVDTEDGRIVTITTYRDGEEDGPEIEYFPDGTKESEGTYSKGTVVGEWRTWYPNGQLKQFSHFDRWGALHKRQRWDEQGNLIDELESPGFHGDQW
jgi:antitoxin component YwqK of YwqJK toxin-antitoxin module